MIQQQQAPIVIPPDPHAEEVAQFDSDVADIISEIEGEFNHNAVEEDGGEPVQVEIPGEEAEKPAPEADTEDKDDPAVARGLDRLVAREVALKVREDAAAAAEARARKVWEDAQTEAKKYTGMKSIDELKALSAHSPIEVMKALGQDPAVMIRLALAEEIKAAGKPVPPELAEYLEKAERKREITSIRRELQEKDEALSAQAYFNTVQNEIRQYVAKVGDSTPTVKAVAAANPQLVFDEISEEIAKDAQAKAARDPYAALMTYEEAAKRVEARWAPIKAVSGPTAENDPKKNAQGAKRISPPAAKPPAKPIMPWMARSSSDLEDQAIKEAMREFNRVEAERKRR